LSNKVLIIIATGEKEKALTGFFFAINSLKNEWFESVKVVLMGPSENLMANNQELQELTSDIFKYESPFACRFIAENNGLSENLVGQGYEVEYVGPIIATFIKAGYLPMVY